MRYLLIFAGLVHMSLTAIGQTFFAPKKYPARTFRNPLGIPFAFVGNFGETRPDHFHSGLDIRTGGKENLPVYAVEDGYISRVKIEARGFGNAIYITHANGYTTVYAHLNKFFPELEAYVRKKQYQQQNWVFDQTFFPDQFWVRKGSFIAWSGNTGSSQGPHLHFEVRNGKTEAPLNPLLFYDEISDSKSPVFQQLAVYDGRESIFEQTPAMYTVTKGHLKKDTLVVNSDRVFFGFRGDDFMPMGAGTLGVYEMNLYADGQAILGWQLDNISYDLTRYVNALADYKTRKTRGLTFQLCRKLPNNQLPVFKSFNNNDGVISLRDGESKRIEIELYDTRNNMTALSFVIQCQLKPNTPACAAMMKAGKQQKFQNEHLALSLDERALYDDICFKSSVRAGTNPYSFIYQVHDNFVPVHTPIELSLKPRSPIPDALKNKLAVVLRKGNERGKAYVAVLQAQMVKAQVTEFGDYEIVIDQQAPVIMSKLKNGLNVSKYKTLNFIVKEETTTVKKCTLTVDGQWLRLSQKGNTWTYEFDEYFPSGTHTLQIIARDEHDNTSTQTYTLTR